MSDDEILVQLRRVCLAFPEAAESRLQDRPLFHVHRRRFAIFNSDHLVRADGSPARPRRRWAGSGRSLHFLTDPAERDALDADPRFTISPHHGDRGWLALSLPTAVLPTAVLPTAVLPTAVLPLAVLPPSVLRPVGTGGDPVPTGGGTEVNDARRGEGNVPWQEISELLEAAYRTAAPRHLADLLDARSSPSDPSSPRLR